MKKTTLTKHFPCPTRATNVKTQHAVEAIFVCLPRWFTANSNAVHISTNYLFYDLYLSVWKSIEIYVPFDNWQVVNIASEASYARWYTNERIVPNNQRLRPCVYFWCMYCCWLCNNGDLGAKIQIMEDSDTKWKAHYFRREYSNVRKEHWHLRWKLLYQTEWNSCKIDFKVSNSSLSNLQNDLPVKVLLEFVHHPWIPSNITVHF